VYWVYIGDYFSIDQESIAKAVIARDKTKARIWAHFSPATRFPSLQSVRHRFDTVGLNEIKG